LVRILNKEIHIEIYEI